MALDHFPDRCNAMLTAAHESFSTASASVSVPVGLPDELGVDTGADGARLREIRLDMAGDSPTRAEVECGERYAALDSE